MDHVQKYIMIEARPTDVTMRIASRVVNAIDILNFGITIILSFKRKKMEAILNWSTRTLIPAWVLKD